MADILQPLTTRGKLNDKRLAASAGAKAREWINRQSDRGISILLHSLSRYSKFPLMSVTAERLKTELAQLPESDRAALAYFLICSLEGAPGLEEGPELDAELQRRLNDIQTGKVRGEPAENVFREMRKKA